MDNPRGKVIAFVDRRTTLRAIVDVDAGVFCPRCTAGTGCGAGLFSGAAGKRRIEALVPAGLQLAEGDSVEIGMQPDNLIMAAVLVYGLPLLGAVAAAGIAYRFSAGDGAAAAAAVTGLVAGGIAGRLYLKRDDCLSRFVPVIEKRVAAAGTHR
jgi:positive regulator of sigma E activity